HFLHAVFDDQDARRDDRTRQFAGRGPAAHPAQQQDHNRATKPYVTADREVSLMRSSGRSHDLPPTTVTEAGRRTRCNTSALLPKAWTRPSARTSSMSTAASTFGRWAMTTTTPERSRTPEIARVSASSPSESRFE